MNARTSTLLLALTTIVPACAPDDQGDLEFRTTFTCTSCQVGGSNSAHANLYPISQIYLSGDPNADGIVLMGIDDPATGKRYELRTEGDELVAWDSITNTVGGTGNAIVGWDIVFYSNAEANEQTVRIFGYDPAIPSEAPAAAPISGYALAYENPEAENEWLSVCPDVLNTPDAIAVTIVSGELYDEESKEVIPDYQSMTIACFGNAVAKMKLFNYGPNQDFDGQGNPASVAQRQATIRMITADYCGDGTSFTADNTPLDWENLSQTVTSGTHAFADIEAVWYESGAYCLTNPRVASLLEVEGYCSLPVCDEQVIAGAGYGEWEWVTWIP